MATIVNYAARRAMLTRASRVARFWRVVVAHLPGSNLPREIPSAAAKPAAKPHVPDEIDVTSEDSFPASDPPAWTSSRA